MTRSALLAASLLLASLGVHAQHVHGEGRLDAIFDKETLTLALTLPLDAAVGFERPPRNDKEKAALDQAAKTLEDKTLWRPTPAAQCNLEAAKVSVPFIGGQDRHDSHAHEGEQHHADIEAEYVFRCANPAALTSVATTLFTSMKRLYRLEAQKSGPAGQGAQRLTPKAPVLNW